jgi:hypothetical protein
MASLMVRAVGAATIRTRWFQAVAEQLVLADADLFGGRYAEALTTALVRRGLLPLRSVASPAAAAARNIPAAAAAAARFAVAMAGGPPPGQEPSEPVRVALDGAALGLPVATFYVEAPAIDDAPPSAFALGIAGAEPPPPGRALAVQSFVEELILRGRLNVGVPAARGVALVNALTRRRTTHQLVQIDNTTELRRITFDCGCGCGG